VSATNAPTWTFLDNAKMHCYYFIQSIHAFWRRLKMAKLGRFVSIQQKVNKHFNALAFSF